MKPVKYPYTARQCNLLLGLCAEHAGIDNMETQCSDAKWDELASEVDRILLASVPFVADGKPLVICRLADECAYPFIEVIGVDESRLIARLEPKDFNPRPPNPMFWGGWIKYAEQHMAEAGYTRWTDE